MANWTCDRCTLENQSAISSCSACGQKKSEATATKSEATATKSEATATKSEVTATSARPPVPPRPSKMKVEAAKMSVEAENSRGDSWECYACSYRNEARSPAVRSRCEMCDAPRLGSAASSAPSTPSGLVSPVPKPIDANGSVISKGWQCINCKHFIQDQKSLKCSKCDARRQFWDCAHCTVRNPIAKPKCHVCATGRNPTRPPSPSLARHRHSVNQESVWPCPTCSYHNKLNDAHCAMCQQPKRVNANNTTNTTSINTGANSSNNNTNNTNNNSSNSPAGVNRPQSVRIQSDFMEKLLEDDEKSSKEMLDKIIAFCRTNRMNFVDAEFAPAAMSIGEFSDEEFTKHVPPHRRPNNTNLVWLRPQDIVTRDGLRWRWAVFRDPQPSDIEQGVLGNCWFLSALAVIAERPELLEHIVLNKQYMPEGVYQIRLCVDGQWRILTVDDHFPCYQDRTMAFTVGRRNQLWVPLIEKALAKVVGSYATLRAGRSVEAFAILTGAPCESISLEGDNYYQHNSFGDGDGDTGFDKDLVWARLISAKEAGFVMGASCGAGKRTVVDADFEAVGLLSKHAYSVMDVQIAGNERLVRLRNPWGQFVWKGEWCDASPRWTADLRRQLMPGGILAGAFWMPFDQFVNYFDSVDVCKLRNGWKELRLPGVLPPYWLQGKSQATRLIVPEQTELALTLYQEESRRQNKDNLDLLILVLRQGLSTRSSHCNIAGLAEKSVGEQEFRSKRQVSAFVSTTDAFLRPGTYLVVCCSFNHWGTSVAPKSVLAVHSSRTVLAENITVAPTTLADALISMVLKEGKLHTSSPACVPRYMTKDFSGMIAVVDNLSEDYCVQVRCDCSRSTNVVSTRGAMSIVDSVPPLHRQILLILSQCEPTQNYSMMHVLEHRVSMHGGLRDWAPANTPMTQKNANHFPALTEFVHGLHSPRPLFV